MSAKREVMSAGKTIAALMLVCGASGAPAQSWSPQKNVEIVVGSAPGGSNDKTARSVERMIQQLKLVPTSVTVNNRPGGGSNIAFGYVQQHAGDPHYLMVGTPSLLTNHITGLSKLHHNDYTPIASLLNDYVVFVVNASAPIRNGRDLAERLKKDPKSVSIGFATTLGSHNHIAAGLLAKTVGVNARDLKAIAHKGSAEAIANLLGGHIDLVTTAAGNIAGHVAAGKLRVIGVAAERRLPGALADAPTWKEQGVNLVFGGWRGILAPKALTPQQSAYWEGVMKKATEAPEWKSELEKNYWADDFVAGQQFRKELDRDYAAMRAVLIDVGLAK